ncbi:N-acyl homoserine lactonase family protein [Acuticoccus sp.]|uniref:N-acyl homoserine lactonase family protein n=1 Tax=Acuticoccus sp. TaxID=1904378 RepID=UPI003B51ACCD
MSDDVYEVFAVRYARVDRPRTQNFLGGDPHDAPMPLNYYVWVVRNAARTVVVDTGYGPKSAERRGRPLELEVPDALARLGVDATAVEDVIITHLHYDHAGNIERFPRARFHIQDQEMAYATGRSMTHALLRMPFDVQHVTAMVERLYEGRVVFRDPVDEVAPGITVHHIGGHSMGLQVVRVMTARGPVVLASDATHFYEHFETDRAFVIVQDVTALLEGYRTLRRLAGSDRRVVPGHDPLVMDRYPAPDDCLRGIAVRLDVDPTG